MLPEVYRMAAMSVSMTRCPGRGAAASRSGHDTICTPGGRVRLRLKVGVRVGGCAGGSVTTTWRSAGQSPSTGANRASRSGEVTSTCTPQSRAMKPTCSGLSNGFMGTNTPPAAGAPKLAMTVSKRFSR